MAFIPEDTNTNFNNNVNKIKIYIIDDLSKNEPYLILENKFEEELNSIISYYDLVDELNLFLIKENYKRNKETIEEFINYANQNEILNENIYFYCDYVEID